MNGPVKKLSNIQTNTATPLAYRSSRFSTFPFFIVISLYFLISIHNVYAAQVTLAWEQNTEPDIAGYKIYYGDSSGNYPNSVNITPWNVTTCTISDLIEGQTYYFAATAYYSNLVESDYSAEISYNSNPATTTSTVIKTTTTAEPATNTSTTTSVSGGGGHGGGGSYSSTTTTAAASTTTIVPAFTTTTIPASTTTTVFDSECSIKSVKATGLPLKSGLLKPRLRRIVITGSNSNWDRNSEITIDDINFILKLRVENDKITALISIPPQLFGFQPGVKDVTIVKGSEICIGTLEVE